jgi:uncharacterized protein (DUF58 family)
VQIHPTRAAVDLALCGMLVLAAGIIAQQGAIVAWGGALLVGLAIARAVTELGVSRIRAAGFEMLWRNEPRLVRLARGESHEFEAEVRNRDTRAARYVELRPVCSPNLEVRLEPEAGEVPAGARLKVTLTVRAPRVGRHGIHGLSLEVQGGPGLYEVPLTFANPYGLEVMPQPMATWLRSPRGGRSRMSADEGRPGPLSGDGMEIRELREHQPGDPFKRIAWKASARRGTLMVRDYEREERDVVWLLLDASVELWSGAPGTAPLDLAIDEIAAVAGRHLARGDRVGLGIVASRVLAWHPPDRGAAHGAELFAALAHATGTYDGDRSDYDEADVAARVIEHMRPLDPAAAHRVRSSDFDRIARRVERLRSRAPFPASSPHAKSRRERVLRAYLAGFGIASPPRLEPERPHTDRELAGALERIARERPRASVVYVWSAPLLPSARPEIERVLGALPRKRIELRWVIQRQAPSIPTTGGPLMPVVADAVRLRATVAEELGERALRRLGVRVERPRPPARSSTHPPG